MGINAISNSIILICGERWAFTQIKVLSVEANYVTHEDTESVVSDIVPGNLQREVSDLSVSDSQQD